MNKKIIGKDIPLLFACSGGSNAAELVESVARKLAKNEVIYMSCPPVISARVDFFLEKLRHDEKVIALDGCETDCISQTMKNSGFEGFLHVKLSDMGISKSDASNEKRQIDIAYNFVIDKISSESIWGENKFSYRPEKDMFLGFGKRIIAWLSHFISRLFSKH